MSASALELLRAGVASAFPDATAIEIDARMSPYTTGAPIHHVDVWTGTTLEALVAKDLASHALIPAAAGVKPWFLRDAHREPFVYASVLATRPGVARHHTTIVAGGEPRWLVIERVAGCGLDQIGDMDLWCDAAFWLGAFHRATPVAPDATCDPLLVHDERWYAHWSQRAAAALGDRAPAWLAAFESASARLAELPRSVVHGDCSAANVLVDAGGRICPIDWELAAVGTGLSDLADLVAGLPADDVAAMVAAYEDGNGAAIDGDDLLLARLHACVRWLGWSQDWAPPAARTRDWLGDARCFAAELGLA